MNSTKIVYQRGFNDLYFKFIDDIILMFKDDKDFYVAKTTFETMKRSNPSILVKGWYTFIITPYIVPNVAFELNLNQFLNDFHIFKQQNRITELNSFFEKLKTEINNLTITNTEENMTKYAKIENYFNQLNKMAILYNSQ